MSTTQLIGAADIDRIVRAVGLNALMDEMIDGIARTLIDYETVRYDSPPRSGFNYTEPREGLVEWMPVYERQGRITIKVVAYHPENPERLGLPTVLSTVAAFDSLSGHLVGIADATFLTAMRTGATSGVATRILARSSSTTLGLIGCGAQAVSQLHAILRILPIDTVLIHDADVRRQTSFGQRVSILADSLEIKESPIDRILADSDVVCTMTSLSPGSGPLFSKAAYRPWLHINAVGSDFPGKHELPLDLLRDALVVPDFLPQAVKEGECQQLEPHEIGPSLDVLVKSPPPGVSEQKTVFDSTGWALTDHVAMSILMDHAEQMGVGTPIQLETSSGDPFAPYHFSTDSIESGALARAVEEA